MKKDFNNKRFVQPQFCKGVLVWIYKALRENKLLKNWHGPAVIIKAYPEFNIYDVRNLETGKIRRKVNSKQLQKYKSYVKKVFL